MGGKGYQHLIPEGVAAKEFELGLIKEMECGIEEGLAVKLVKERLKEDARYYSKIHEDVEEHCGACEDDMEGGIEKDLEDVESGLPKLGGALAVVHHGQPIHMSKIVQTGNEFGHGPASGELSGYQSTAKPNSVNKDKGGLPVNVPGDKETITAGGKSNGNAIATKSVGGPVSPGEGQKQGGLNTKGRIAGTEPLNEQKKKVREVIKEVLKEIKFDKKTGKWIKIQEGKVDMHMGASYKVVQPTLAKTIGNDFFARTNQFDPHISEMYDEEEEGTMNERFTELATAGRNLSETELAEMKKLRETLDRIGEGRCEDYPCCGHEPGDCPDRDKHGNETYRCAGCHGKLPPHSQSSLCPKCLQKVHRAGDDPTGQDLDNLFGHDEYEQQQEGSDKWIQKAVNPKHKGACTPMSKSSCTPHRKALAKRFKSGDLSEGDMDCNCGAQDRAEHRPHSKDCNVYKNEATVNMKMGPAYKKVQQTLAKTSEPDQFARTNQYDPEVSEEAKGEPKGHKGQEGYQTYVCGKCGHEVIAHQKPAPIKWTDGHICSFGPEKQKSEPEVKEAGGQSVQHRSFRTIKDAPQNPEARWSDEVYEGEESDVSKSIKKGMKTKKSKPASTNPLKFRPTKKTTSGVHKRKT